MLYLFAKAGSVQVRNELTLSLLVTWVGAHDIDATFSSHDFAIFANPLYAGADFHGTTLVKIWSKWKRLSISIFRRPPQVPWDPNRPKTTRNPGLAWMVGLALPVSQECCRSPANGIEWSNGLGRPKSSDGSDWVG